MILANSGTRVSRNPEAIPSRSGSRPFAGVRFRGFRLCTEVFGDDMDGVLASMTLDDLSVHEVRLSGVGGPHVGYLLYCAVLMGAVTVYDFRY